jgi:penicillin-binding protein 1C
MSTATDALHIAGLPDKSVVHRAGRRAVDARAPDPAITLTPIGGRGDLYWLVNGNLVERKPPRERFVYRFPARGIYEVTVFDESGAYDRVSLNVID